MHGTQRPSHWIRSCSRLFCIRSIRVISRRMKSGITHVGLILSALGKFVLCADFATIAYRTSGLFKLHRHCIARNSISRNLSIESHQFQKKSLLALKSLARSLMANSRNQTKELFSDHNYMPPYGLHYFRDAALFSLEMERRGEDSDAWRENFGFIRDCLIVSSRKWKIASRYLAPFEIILILGH